MTGSTAPNPGTPKTIILPTSDSISPGNEDPADGIAVPVVHPSVHTQESSVSVNPVTQGTNSLFTSESSPPENEDLANEKALCTEARTVRTVESSVSTMTVTYDKNILAAVISREYFIIEPRQTKT